MTFCSNRARIEREPETHWAMYYSQILKAASIPEKTLGDDFFVALKAYLELLVGKMSYLTSAFPANCPVGTPLSCDQSHMRYQLQSEVGSVGWPIAVENFQTQAQNTKLLDVIEFFHKFVAKPKGFSPIVCHCRTNHPFGFNSKAAQLEFCTKINQMFKSFNHPYEMNADGRIRLKTSAVLDSWVCSLEFQSSDEVLMELLKSGLENFYDKSGTRKLEGLKSIVGVFERLKSGEDSDKKRSVGKIIATLSKDVKLQQLYDTLFRTLTDLGNEQTIRHTEKDKAHISTEDTATIEYLFYSFYSIVRLILTSS